MESVEDWTLVKRACDGDMAAFADIVRKYERPVLRYCVRMTHSMPDAEEAAQDAFLRLFRALPRLTPESAFTTLLFRIAHNAALNQLRGATRRQRRLEAFERMPDMQPGVPTADVAAREKDIAALVESSLLGIVPELREALILRVFHGFDYQGIAEIQACPIGTVRSRIARAREQLRSALMAYGDDVL